MRKKKPETHHNTDAPAAPAPPRVAVLALVLSHLDGVGASLRKLTGEGASSTERTPWKRYFPAAARAAADMIDLAPPLFTWLPFSAESLRTLEREVFHLGEIRSFLTSLLDLVDELVAARKDELARKTTSVLTGLAAVQASPMTPPEVRDRLAELGKAVTDIVEEHNAAVFDKRLRTTKLRATVDTLSSENEELRAELESEAETPQPLAAARRTRRSRR